MTRKLTVLLVDDDLDSCEVMQMSIAAFCGADTRSAHDAKSALELARELLPDAIVLDVDLPGADGMTLARWIRSDERFGGTTLIAATGYTDMRAACLEAGCDHFVLKPVDVSELRGLIQRGRPTS